MMTEPKTRIDKLLVAVAAVFWLLTGLVLAARALGLPPPRWLLGLTGH
jgi:hypothetical protein